MLLLPSFISFCILGIRSFEKKSRRNIFKAGRRAKKSGEGLMFCTKKKKNVYFLVTRTYISIDGDFNHSDGVKICLFVISLTVQR